MTLRKSLLATMGLTALMTAGVANASGNGSVTVGVVQTTIDSAHLHDPAASATSNGVAVEWVPVHFFHHYGYGVSANMGTDEGSVFTTFLEGNINFGHTMKFFAKAGVGYATGAGAGGGAGGHGATTTTTTTHEATDSKFSLVGAGLSFNLTHDVALTVSGEYTSTKATTALVGFTFNY